MEDNIDSNIGGPDRAYSRFEALIMKLPDEGRAVESIQFADKTINVFRATTLNSEYWFARINENGSTGWRVMKGRPELLGKAVHLYGVNLATGAAGIAAGGRLAVHCFNEKDSQPIYTSKILRLEIL